MIKDNIHDHKDGFKYIYLLESRIFENMTQEEVEASAILTATTHTVTAAVWI